MAAPEATLDLLLEVSSLLGADTRRDLERRGLTESRTHLLWLLAEGPRTQQHLARAMRVAPRTVTGLVDGLTATGFVSREPHPDDRRAVLVTPTAHGAEVLADLVDGHRRLADQLFGDLDETDAESLTASLRTVVGRLRDLIGDDDEDRGEASC